MAPDAVLPRGSLAAEIDPDLMDEAPLIFVRRAAGDELLSLVRTEDGRLSVLQRRGGRRISLSVSLGRGPHRLTLTWDAIAGRTRLSAECILTGTIRQQSCLDAVPLSVLAARALCAPREALHRAIAWWVVTPQRLSVGPGAFVAPDTVLTTPSGPRRASALAEGDRILTVDGRALPVLWSGSVTAPALGSCRGVRLLSPFHSRGEDLVVHPNQRLIVGGEEVEYLFGEPSMMVEARHMVNGRTAIWAEPDPAFAWRGFLLPESVPIRANGCVIRSLDIGRLAREPAVAATTAMGLLSVTGRLPLHRPAALRIAAPYEASALSQAIARRLSPVAA